MTNTVDFYKFHGAGNDFVMIDNRRPQADFTVEQVARLCSRRFGIGADGLILLQQPMLPDVDFSMRYFNSDGREASLCGNGSRCVVAFANFLKIIDKKCRFSAFDGIHSGEITDFHDDTWNVSVSMNDVIHLTNYDDGIFLDTGSPHFVVFVEDANGVDVFNEGRRLRHDVRFPEGSNIDFCSPDGSGIFMRTYERGVEDETWACGTGVTATALAWAQQRHFANGDYELPIRMRGGDFKVAFKMANCRFSSIYLKGPATIAFKGQVVL